MNTQINAAVIGYGLSGKVFHAPFIQVHNGFHLHTIVSSKGDAKADYPEVNLSMSYDDVVGDPDIDLIVVCSPNVFHFDQAKAALEHGKHVVLEKPVTPTFKDAQELIRIARANGKTIFPYQNRRWDGDFLTIRRLIDSGMLGEIHDFISHFDRFVPEIGRASWRYENEVAGGTLYDLGVHMIDQALALFGKPQAVFCRLFNQRPGSVTDDSFNLQLIYPRLNVTLKAGVFVRDPGPRFILHGTQGSFVKHGLDPQEPQLRQGMMPDEDGFGVEPEEKWGWMTLDENGKAIRSRVKTLPGRYMGFYDDVLDCIHSGRSPQVTVEQGAYNIDVIEKARESAALEQVIYLQK